MRHLSNGGVIGAVGDEGMLMLEVGCEEADGDDAVAACDEATALVEENLTCSEEVEEMLIVEEVLCTNMLAAAGFHVIFIARSCNRTLQQG
jgi:hypothetical protein